MAMIGSPDVMGWMSQYARHSAKSDNHPDKQAAEKVHDAIKNIDPTSGRGTVLAPAFNSIAEAKRALGLVLAGYDPLHRPTRQDVDALHAIYLYLSALASPSQQTQSLTSDVCSLTGKARAALTSSYSVNEQTEIDNLMKNIREDTAVASAEAEQLREHNRQTLYASTLAKAAIALTQQQQAKELEASRVAHEGDKTRLTDELASTSTHVVEAMNKHTEVQRQLAAERAAAEAGRSTLAQELRQQQLVNQQAMSEHGSMRDQLAALMERAARADAVQQGPGAPAIGVDAAQVAGSGAMLGASRESSSYEPAPQPGDQSAAHDAAGTTRRPTVVSRPAVSGETGPWPDAASMDMSRKWMAAALARRGPSVGQDGFEITMVNKARVEESRLTSRAGRRKVLLQPTMDIWELALWERAYDQTAVRGTTTTRCDALCGTISITPIGEDNSIASLGCVMQPWLTEMVAQLDADPTAFNSRVLQQAKSIGRLDQGIIALGQLAMVNTGRGSSMLGPLLRMLAWSLTLGTTNQETGDPRYCAVKYGMVMSRSERSTHLYGMDEFDMRGGQTSEHRHDAVAHLCPGTFASVERAADIRVYAMTLANYVGSDLVQGRYQLDASGDSVLPSGADSPGVVVVPIWAGQLREAEVNFITMCAFSGLTPCALGAAAMYVPETEGTVGRMGQQKLFACMMASNSGWTDWDVLKRITDIIFVVLDNVADRELRLKCLGVSSSLNVAGAGIKVTPKKLSELVNRRSGTPEYPGPAAADRAMDRLYSMFGVTGEEERMAMAVACAVWMSGPDRPSAQTAQHLTTSERVPLNTAYAMDISVTEKGGTTTHSWQDEDMRKMFLPEWEVGRKMDDFDLVTSHKRKRESQTTAIRLGRDCCIVGMYDLVDRHAGDDDEPRLHLTTCDGPNLSVAEPTPGLALLRAMGAVTMVDAVSRIPVMWRTVACGEMRLAAAWMAALVDDMFGRAGLNTRSIVKPTTQPGGIEALRRVMQTLVRPAVAEFGLTQSGQSGAALRGDWTRELPSWSLAAEVPKTSAWRDPLDYSDRGDSRKRDEGGMPLRVPDYQLARMGPPGANVDWWLASSTMPTASNPPPHGVMTLTTVQPPGVTHEPVWVRLSLIQLMQHERWSLANLRVWMRRQNRERELDTPLVTYDNNYTPPPQSFEPSGYYTRHGVVDWPSFWTMADRPTIYLDDEKRAPGIVETLLLLNVRPKLRMHRGGWRQLAVPGSTMIAQTPPGLPNARFELRTVNPSDGLSVVTLDPWETGDADDWRLFTDDPGVFN